VRAVAVVSFNQINKKTGHRIRYLKVDADTGEECPMKTSSKAIRSIRTAVSK
jgi:non-homologous end joining protein Ku